MEIFVAVIGAVLFVGLVLAKVFVEARFVRPRSVAAYLAPQLGEHVLFPFANGKACGTVRRFSDWHVWISEIRRRGEREKYLNGHISRRPIAAVTRL